MSKLYSTEELLKEITGKPKPQQITILKQEKMDYLLLTQTNVDKAKNSLQYVPGFEEEIDQLLLQIEADESYKYDCDWNWFFNADNIPNQKLVFSTKDFLDTKYKDEAESLLMFNTLLRQMDELKSFLDKPVSFVTKQKELPITEEQRYTLMGLLLKWHGGYPVNNLNPKYNTLLKLLEKEFLAMFSHEARAEKEFCSIDFNEQKKLREVELHIQAEFNKQFSFTESKYFNKIDIDFDDLPEYIIRQGIVRKFDSLQLVQDQEYLEWKSKLLDFIQTVPNVHVEKLLRKGIEYGEKVYAYHLLNECSNPSGCIFNQSWVRRIAMTKNILKELVQNEEIEEKTNTDHQSEMNVHTPMIELSNAERLWLEEVYTRTKNGTIFTFKDIWSKLHDALPYEFHPEKIDGRLVSKNGEDILLLGVIAIEKNFSILEKINKVINTIREIILKDGLKRHIPTTEIAEDCLLNLNEINIVLRLVRYYGSFYTGCSSDADNTLLKTIDVGGSDAVYYQYIQFQGIQQLIALKKFETFAQSGEKFTISEMKEMSQKIDLMLKELETLKLGHEIIWTDLLNELNDLKAHFGLTKKNWKQLFIGKILEMVGSGVISETVSKKIVESLNPLASKLIS